MAFTKDDYVHYYMIQLSQNNKTPWGNFYKEEESCLFTNLLLSSLNNE